jgi:hypothetical protein
MTRQTARRRPKQHYTVDMDLDDDSRPVTLDARSLTLPSVAVIAVVLSSMGLTYFLAEERTRLDNRIDIVVNSVERLAVSISQLADGLKYGAGDRFTRTQHELWCARTEILNKGFKCGDIDTTSNGALLTPPALSIDSTLEGVKREMSSVQEKAAAAKRLDGDK